MLKQRRAAAKKYQPAKVNILIIAEAPPCDLGRYFYFEDVQQHDWLFRYTYEALYDEKPTRENKPAHLQRLRDDGIFLFDLHEENVSQPTLAQLTPLIPDLIKRCQALNPKRIILVKSIVHDAAYQPLKSANLPVINERIPFPASGQQRKFLDGFRKAMKAKV